MNMKKLLIAVLIAGTFVGGFIIGRQDELPQGAPVASGATLVNMDDLGEAHLDKLTTLLGSGWTQSAPYYASQNNVDAYVIDISNPKGVVEYRLYKTIDKTKEIERLQAKKQKLQDRINNIDAQITQLQSL